ncbi:4-(cytidine 5'-diphospho)-2-C-methyl-D-erythritol kinase [Parasphingorhabdus cellanae]|uniref:4-diphosphocytidyl-2-C-methyl-D-erythritol kinase n=1 Tax=Parasphingorhabdus cellanae TaxID=2806553 RepID=A0ABX7T768_9SPHN|nr:4-(cytidine 5'-diphospho)-2-C-methyl-D-erythritol kinase [Parasphingorhabdus cellanae]QTD56309.1 4-(cytidine 5'-diphospho)-2-C-methyl-D-erythritol kinase [Parasphingorhabdus cellanae]
MTAENPTIDDSEIACAKINLALHVRRRLPDGYHDIETIFAFLDCGDHLSVIAGTNIELSVEGQFSDGLSNSDNLVLDAARLLALHANIDAGAKITLDKRLPVASGIGGGSADAAATLRLLNRFWNTELSLESLAKLSEPLGADVPACVINQTCHGAGIGQDLMPIENGKLSGHHVLLVNPLVPVSTAAVFRDWDGVDHGGLEGSDPLLAAMAGRNDLQKPAQILAPVIGDLLSELNKTDSVIARMSGSGATCFGIYETEQLSHAAEKRIVETLPNVWTMVGGLR